MSFGVRIIVVIEHRISGTAPETTYAIFNDTHLKRTLRTSGTLRSSDILLFTVNSVFTVLNETFDDTENTIYNADAFFIY